MEKELSEEIKKLKKENNELKKKLKKYTAPERNRIYYENNKEEIIKKNLEYSKNNPTSKEKRREYNRRAYLKRKESEN